MNWNPMVPELLVEGFEASLHFYVDIIGFDVAFQRTNPRFAYLDLNGAQLMIEADHDDAWMVDAIVSPRGRGLNLQIDVPDLEVVSSRLELAGVVPFRAARERWYETSEGPVGQFELLVQDPDGYLIRLVSDVQDVVGTP
ncbi:MAG: bleomycin resistance protein [Candidatus Nanopelagicales bacterium]